MKAEHEFSSNEEYKKYLKTYFAAMAMQGMLAANFFTVEEGWAESLAAKSIGVADALLKQLEK